MLPFFKSRDKQGDRAYGKNLSWLKNSDRECPDWVYLSYLPGLGEAFRLLSYRLESDIYGHWAIAPTISLQKWDAPDRSLAIKNCIVGHFNS